MNWKFVIPAIILLFIYNQMPAQEHFRQSVPAVIDAVEVFTDIADEITHLENKFDTPQVKKIIDKIDIFCSQAFIDSSGYDFGTLLDAAEAMTLRKNDLALYSSITNEYMLEISFNELYFRILIAVQKRILSLYKDLESGQKLEYIPVLATINSDISQIKTRLVSRQVWILSSCEKKAEILRGWLAIKRMLDEIDIQKSESGDPVVQRSPYGIITSPGETLNKLTFLSENEEDTDIGAYSSGLVKMISETPSKYEEYKTEIALSELGLYNSFGTRINQQALSFFSEALATKSPQKKIVLYTNAIENDSSFAAAYNNRALCYYDEKNYKAAEEDFLKVLRLDPGYFTVYKYLGNCSYKAGRFNDAVKNFTEALKYEVSDTLFINRGSCFQKSGLYEQAVSDFSSAIKFNPKSLTAYLSRVQCYLALRHYESASEDYRKLTRLDPLNSNHYYNLGCTYAIQKNWDKVIEVWQKGLIINPDDKNIRENLPKAKLNLSRQKEKK